MFSIATSLKFNKIRSCCLTAIKLTICLGSMIIFVTAPGKYSISFLNGLTLFAKNVLPVLFPFFFITKVLNSLGVSTTIGKALSKLLGKLYNSPEVSGYIFAMNLISGYPIGASITADCYRNGTINKSDALCITAFCSSGGPIFILGTVNGFFGNTRFTCVLLITNYLSAIINGFIYRNKQTAVNQSQICTATDKLPSIIKNSILGVLQVGGFITLFNILIDMIDDIGIIEFFASMTKPFLSHEQSTAFLFGIIEMTRGCSMLSISGATLFNACISSFMISFGGIAIALQSMSYLSECGITFGELLIRKFSQAVISFVIAIPLGLLLLT